MSASIIIPGRRTFLSAVGAAAFTPFFTTKGLFAEALVETVAMTEGPYYPDKMPLDTDNDLLIINDAVTPAEGAVTWLTGRVQTSSGQPVRNAFVEIWQTDNKGSYIHTKGRNVEYDGNFQGYGRYLTDSTGRYVFRTLRPISYTIGGQFRAPHIHVALSQHGKRTFTTMVGIRGHKDNAIDLVYKTIKPEALKTVMLDYTPLPGSSIGELTAKFDLILGRTAAESEDGTMLGGVGKPLGVWRRNRG